MIQDKQSLSFRDLFSLQKGNTDCGLFTKQYYVNTNYGNGHLISYAFDGLYIEYFQGIFKENLEMNTKSNVNCMELSFLLSGEKVILGKASNENLVHEAQDCLLSCSKSYGGVSFYKKIPIKQVTIRLYYEFIKKHQILTLIPLFNTNRKMYTEYSSLKVTFSLKTQNILYEIIQNTQSGILKRLFLESKILELVSLQVQKNKKSKPNESLIKKMYTVKNTIAFNLNQHYTVKELSRSVLLNDTVLKKEFKRIFDQTISEFSLSARMEKAKEFLLYSSKPIYEVSDLVGYKNPTHFSAAFKKYTKLTPKKYRDLSIRIK